MSQSSSGPLAIELLSPDSPPWQEQGINQIDLANSEMDTSISVSKEDLADNDYLAKNPAAKRTSEPALEHYLFFEELLKNGQSTWTFQCCTKRAVPDMGESFHTNRRVQQAYPSHLHVYRSSCHLHPTPTHQGDPCCQHHPGGRNCRVPTNWLGK
ncbi:hypothetical protein CDAR_288941 [Caerostris darwini]|uniref:Uncharacterized protein n=1 Tax=Caerostris darwini TaxID=1538125 RepID=A0AAV4Q2E4_9ARAC|nr:hypothetical protein CDAR_288941 [Caerostris darwini]